VAPERRNEGLQDAVPKAGDGIQRLDVYRGTALVGVLFDTEPISFEYSRQWLGKPDSFALPGIALASARAAGERVAAFFDNLLPEGALRDHIGKQRHASTLFALLREVGGDTAGGLLILREGDKPRKPRYRKVSWTDLAGYSSGKGKNAAVDIHAESARISLSGAQDKMLIALDEKGRPLLPLGESPSTHILKPDIKGLAKIHHSAANEAIVMAAAAHAKLQVAETFYEQTTGACIVKRFDRLRRGKDLVRLMQFDFCQLCGTVSNAKYESEGGPGILRCAQLIREYSAQPAADLLRLLEWVFFNLYAGNNDSHAKNLSIYAHPRQGTVLTPFYDLMCTRVYSGLARQFAFAIGGENRPGRIGRDHVARMAAELGFRPAYVLEVAEQVAIRLEPAVAAAVSEMLPSLPYSAKILAQKLQWKIASITRQLSTRILAGRG
jgi:serine/threonine-protein kinase HipA